MIHAAKLLTLATVSVLMSGCDLLGNEAEKILVNGGEKANVEIGVNTVNISALGGAGSITGLTIRNPEGYQTDYAFSIDQIGLNLEISSILFKPVTLSEFVLDSPVVNLEVKGPGQNNLKEIADRFAEAYQMDESREIEDAGESEEPEAEENLAEEKEPARIRVDELRIEGVSFNYYPADGNNFSGTLPAIHLTDVGGEEGVTAPRLGAIVALAIGGRILAKRVAANIGERLLDEEGFMANLRQFFVSANSELPANLQQAVHAYVKELQRILETRSTEGFMDLASGREEVSVATQSLIDALKENLNGEQIRQLGEQLAAEREVIVETINDLLIEIIQQHLHLRQAQLATTNVIIRDILEQVASLVERIRVGDLEKVDWGNEYRQLTERNQPRLKAVLDESQMESVGIWINQVDQFILTRYMSEG
jgi:hypothetical protein